MNAQDAAPAPTDATGLPPGQKALALAGVLLGMLLAALDNTIVATAGPNIQKDLHIEAGLYTWITTSYLVSSTVVVPIWGKLSDSLGRRRVLLAGIALFLLGSALCGTAQNGVQLILYRAVQGLGSASLFTSAFAIVGDLYSPRERGRLNGFFGAVFGMSSVIGPLVGGFITDNFSWHWCFFVNLPVGAIAIAFILARMPPLLPRVQKKFHIDVIGSITLSLAVVPLLIGLSLGKAVVREGETGFLWTSWQELTLFGVALFGIISFLLVERRSPDPIVDLKLFSNTAFARGVAAAFVAGLPFLAAVVFLPLFMQRVVGESATGGGLATLPLTLGIVVSNIGSGIATTKTGKYKPFIVAALAWTAMAFAVLAFTLDSDATKLSVSWKMFIIGLGVGPAIPLFALAIQNSVAPQVVGVASSMATFSRQMGATIGIAVFGTVFATTLSDELESKMKEATKDLSPAMVEQLKKGSAPAPAAGGSEEAAPSSNANGFDRVAAEKRVHDSFAHNGELITKALKENDAAAIAELKANPMIDPRLKAALENGGVAAQVQAGFDATLAKVKTALDAGPEAVAALSKELAADPRTAQLGEKLGQIPPPALASPEARAQIFGGISAAMQAAAADAKQKAVDGVVTGATEGMKVGEKTAVDTIGKVDRAFKESFTDAVKKVYMVAVFMAILGLLAALPMPALALRKQAGPSAGPE